MREMNKSEQELESIKALTLWQPYASLIALGIKFIETRSWSTKYRGPLAIHAGLKKPHIDDDAEIWRPLLDPNGSGMLMVPVFTGAVVATCELVDVVPIRTLEDDQGRRDGSVVDMHLFRGLWLIRIGAVMRVIEDQRPYGDFAPGRFAWILDDIKPLSAPIPAKGKQGLWELEMEIA